MRKTGTRKYGGRAKTNKLVKRRSRGSKRSYVASKKRLEKCVVEGRGGKGVAAEQTATQTCPTASAMTNFAFSFAIYSLMNRCGDEY